MYASGWAETSMPCSSSVPSRVAAPCDDVDLPARDAVALRDDVRRPRVLLVDPRRDDVGLDDLGRDVVRRDPRLAEEGASEIPAVRAS